MFDSLISSTDGTVAVGESLICILVSLALGAVISVTYVLFMKKKGVSEHFTLTMVVLPAIVTAVIIMVGSNVARAFSLAGIFALIRFRSVPGDAKDIAFVFLAATVGLTNGMGYIGFGALFTLILCTAFLTFGHICQKFFKDSSKQLKILIPEDMNYQQVFDDLMKKYTQSYELERVKTTNLGSLFELTYKINVDDTYNEKEFIDELRCRNGNLNISISKTEQKTQQL